MRPRPACVVVAHRGSTGQRKTSWRLLQAGSLVPWHYQRRRYYARGCAPRGCHTRRARSPGEPPPTMRTVHTARCRAHTPHTLMTKSALPSAATSFLFFAASTSSKLAVGTTSSTLHASSVVMRSGSASESPVPRHTKPPVRRAGPPTGTACCCGRSSAVQPMRHGAEVVAVLVAWHTGREALAPNWPVTDVALSTPCAMLACRTHTHTHKLSSRGVYTVVPEAGLRM